MICLVFVLMIWSAVSSVCSGEPGKRNVVLITIDTIRADYLGCNGSEKVRTPNLDRICRGGANFKRARSPVPLTLPAHASILTGLYPHSHGVRDNGLFRLSEEHRTLAEVLKENGYQTGAFIGSFVLDSRFGLAQGFDVYEDRAWSDASLMETMEAERSADSVLSAASAWLQTMDSTHPFFLWIHFYDPHAPYVPPEPYRGGYSRDPYSGEIAYTDSVVGKLMDELKRRGWLESVLIAVVGDHGEGLGEHNELTHSVLIYNSTLHVPLIVYAPGSIAPGREVNVLTRIIDLGATILDYVGLEDRLGEGRSLRPLVENRQGIEPLVAASESLYANLHLGWSELRGLETENYHWIESPRPELFDFRNDPAEQKNIVADVPEVAAAMQRRMRNVIAEQDQYGAGKRSAELDPETKEKLAALGYIGTARLPTASSVDPKDKMDVWNEIQLALHEFGERNYAKAAELLQAVLKKEKRIGFVYESLGTCYLRLSDLSRAEEQYRIAIREGFDTSSVFTNLGEVLIHKKELPAAEAALETAIQKDALNVSAYYYLGNIYRSRRQWPEAVEQYRKALSINPDYVFALNALALAYIGSGRDPSAVEIFERIIELNPEGAQGYFNLGLLLERLGRDAEAVDMYQRFLDMTGESGFSQERERAMESLQSLKKPR